MVRSTMKSRSRHPQTPPTRGASRVDTIFGLKIIDLAVVVGYFALVMVIGFWASTKVHPDEDFFLGGRRFGKRLLVMHCLSPRTHCQLADHPAAASPPS